VDGASIPGPADPGPDLGEQARAVAWPRRETGGLEHPGVGPAVAGDRAERHRGQPHRERLGHREAAGVVNQYVGRAHDLGDVRPPAQRHDARPAAQ
jgi:hypothetical protein